MGYYIYRIPEINKVGLAKDLKDRVEDQQGWSEGEYETLGYFGTLKQARAAELLFQKEYDCVDTGAGNDLMDKIIEDQERRDSIPKSTQYTGKASVGFYMAWKDAPELLSNGCIFRLDTGDIIATGEDVKALFDNGTFRESHNGGWGKGLYTYAIVKKVKNYFESKAKNKTKAPVKLDERFNKIRAWATDKGIIPNGNLTTQTLKLGEEFGELQKAVLKDDVPEIHDAIGDLVVVLTSVAFLAGITIEECIDIAYAVISKRKGYTNDKGDFIKDTL